MPGSKRRAVSYASSTRVWRRVLLVCESEAYAQRRPARYARETRGTSRGRDGGRCNQDERGGCEEWCDTAGPQFRAKRSGRWAGVGERLVVAGGPRTTTSRCSLWCAAPEPASRRKRTERASRDESDPGSIRPGATCG